MIVYKDIMQKLSVAGWSGYRLMKEKKLSNGVIVQIKAGKPITTTTIDIICDLLNCQPNDIIEFKKDEE